MREQTCAVTAMLHEPDYHRIVGYAREYDSHSAFMRAVLNDWLEANQLPLLMDGHKRGRRSKGEWTHAA